MEFLSFYPNDSEKIERGKAMPDSLTKKIAPQQEDSSQRAVTRQTILAQGDVYWIKNGGKKTLISRAGEPLNVTMINKLKSKNQKIEIDHFIDLGFVETGVDFLKEFKEINQDRVYREKIFALRKEILAWLKPRFWNIDKDCSLLSLVICCHKSFYNFDMETSAKLVSMSPSLYKRSSIIGTLWSIYGLICGYVDFSYLQDIYNLSFLLDYRLLEKGMGGQTIQALDMERKKAGSGLSFLGKNNFENTRREVFSHPIGLSEHLEKLFGKFFLDISVLKIVDIHHEKLNGKGFPKGINGDEVSDMEAISMFLNQAVSFEEYIYSENDGNGIFNKIFAELEDKSSYMAIARLGNMVRHVFKTIEDDDAHFVMLKGL